MLSTIIINYNTPQLTIQAVRSVLENYTTDQIEGEIIVVDNASTDDSVRLLKQTINANIVVIQNEVNEGFSVANNKAMKVAKGDYFLLLNSDTIVKPGAINAMLDVFRKYPDDFNTQNLSGSQVTLDHIGIVGPQLLNQDGSIQTHGGALPNLLNLSAWWLWFIPGKFPFLSDPKSYHSESNQSFQTERKVGWISGAAFLLKREVYEEIGGLDENIFMYAEDVEYCQRATDHHWDVVITPRAKITHFGSSSSSSQYSLIGEIRGLLYVCAKHFSPLQFSYLRAILWFGTMLRFTLFGIIVGDAKKKQTFQNILELFQKED